MSLAVKARGIVSRQKQEFPDAITFISSQQGFNTRLFPQQRFLIKVLEKMPLDNTQRDIEIRDNFNEKVIARFTEVEFFQYLIEQGRLSLDWDTYLVNEIIQYIFAFGRRGTKSTTFLLYVGYKIAELLDHESPQGYLRVLPSAKLNVPLVSLGEENATKIFSKLVGMIKPSPYFRPYLLEDPITQSIRIWTQQDIKNLRSTSNPPAHSNTITISAYSNGPGVRGDDSIFAIMDELAHYNKSSSSTKKEPLDASLYKAITPAVSGFRKPDGSTYGRVFLLSSPNGKEGKFAEEFENSFKLGAISGSLAIQAPTWELNPSVSPTFLRAEYTKSPSSYRQEYGAELIEGGLDFVPNQLVIYEGVDTSLDLDPPVGKIDKTYVLGMDLALSGDGCAMTLGHLESNYLELPEHFPREAHELKIQNQISDIYVPTQKKNVIVFDKFFSFYPGVPPFEKFKTLPFEEIADIVKDIHRKWPIILALTDQWAGALAKQIMHTKGILTFTPMTHTDVINDAQYRLFSYLLQNHLLKFPYNLEYINELKVLKETKKGRLISVEAKSPFHDDRFDSSIRTCYGLSALFLGDEEALNKICAENEYIKKSHKGQAPATPSIGSVIGSKTHHQRDIRNQSSRFSPS